MRYVIYGAGAIGGCIGARLFAAGHDVVLIARGAHLERIRADGLRERTPAGDAVHRIPAVGHPRELAFTNDDVLVLTMKSQDTASALDDLRAEADDRVAVVCAQNGVDNERLAARRFARVYGMLVYLPATFLEPGVIVVHADPPAGVLDVGRYPSGVDTLSERIAADITGAGFVSRASEDVMRLKYGKLLGNLGNAVRALCAPGSETDEILRLADAEARACFRAAGIAWTSDEESVAIAATVARRDVPGAPRAGSSSWQSLARGTGNIEADYLNGEISLLGRLHGVPTPVNAAVQRRAAE
ncbi:MAG: NAD(P)-binding domain-containing protein, partial [Chloroflexi bacterium]|nr:NAD(P)-binding domain-containing protein [Chloroflexota bacterium]